MLRVVGRFLCQNCRDVWSRLSDGKHVEYEVADIRVLRSFQWSNGGSKRTSEPRGLYERKCQLIFRAECYEEKRSEKFTGGQKYPGRLTLS